MPAPNEGQKRITNTPNTDLNFTTEEEGERINPYRSPCEKKGMSVSS